MLMTIQASHEAPKPGHYHASFSGISLIETKNGAAYRWLFQTVDGTEISGLSDAKAPPTPNNKTGRWLAALNGGNALVGSSVDPDNHIGKMYLLSVDADEKGNGRLITFSKAG